jgi:hypothetical protein
LKIALLLHHSVESLRRREGAYALPETLVAVRYAIDPAAFTNR